jgi:XRE family aerobic/anaerobic benzoate catabolism transcriptional regulator
MNDLKHHAHDAPLHPEQQADPAVASPAGNGERDPFLTALGARVRLLRARRGLTQKALAEDANISVRHLANLETGLGNGSVLVLKQLAGALNTSIAAIVGDETASSAEWLLLRELLHNRSDDALKRARVALEHLFADAERDPQRSGRLALIGLRGAGKSTLGRMLADDFGIPFVELNREIEKLAGCAHSEIHDLYGANAYRRYELRALEATLEAHPKVVIATPGGLVSEAQTFALLLKRCFTVWLQASPEEHMKRVVAQGDMRPMAGRREAMDDLKSILAGRADLYAQADLTYDTGGKALGDAFFELRTRLRKPATAAGAR